MSTPKPAASGEIKKFTPNPSTQTHPVAGRHPAWNQFPFASALDRSVNSVRGKALSLLRSGDIDAIPRQETTKGASKEDPLAELTDIGSMGVEDIAEAIGKTARGVKTMLTRRGLSAADYDGASKKEKASA